MRAGFVGSTRPVDLDERVLKSLRTGAASGQPQTMRITFFDDAVIVAQITIEAKV